MEKFIFLGKIYKMSRHGCVKSEHVLCDFSSSRASTNYGISIGMALRQESLWVLVLTQSCFGLKFFKHNLFCPKSVLT